MPPTTCIIVAGMHRSGTSLVARVLIDMGLAPPTDLLPSHPIDNPGGYFESREVVRINNSLLAASGLSWRSARPIDPERLQNSAGSLLKTDIEAFIEGHKSDHILLKDPRFCRLLPLWLPSLDSCYSNIVILHVIRRPTSVYRSLSRRDEHLDTRNAAITDSFQSDLLWLYYNLDICHYARPRNFIRVAYEDLCTRPAEVVRSVAGELNRLSTLRLKRHSDVPIISTMVQEDVQVLSDRDRLLESIYIELRNSRGAITQYLDATRRTLQQDVPALHQDFKGDHDSTKQFQAARMRHVTGVCEHRPELLGAPNKISMHTREAVPHPIRTRPAPAILFITSDPTSRGHIYRVKNVVEGLSRNGVHAAWISIGSIERVDLDLIMPRCIVMYRCAYDSIVERVFDWAARKRVRVGFDIDDLIFDPLIMKSNIIHFIAQLPAADRARWERDASRYRDTMASAAFCIVPTRALALHAQRVNPDVYVIGNGFSTDFQALSELWRTARTRAPVTKIGYASGTNTHQADFQTIVEPLHDVLMKHSHCNLVLVGRIDVSQYVPPLPASRIEMRAHVEHINLPHELSRFDVNLVPLQLNNVFCDSKSPLKFYEAALVGVPTVASRNPTYDSLIRHDKDGLLAQSAADWSRSITSLVEDREQRERLATEARAVCMELFHENVLAKRYLALVT